MSKRNKRKNKHKFQSAKKDGGQSSNSAAEAKSETLEGKIDNLALQSIKVSNTDTAETTTSKTNDSTSVEVQREEKKAVVELSDAATGKKSNKAGKAFVWGLLIGALIISILF